MFKEVSNKASFPEMDQRVLQFWREHNVFRKSVEQRPEGKRFTFYEGPPYANAAPGVHHILARIFKDVIVRYKSMQGYRVPRKAGWDTHGLPAEMEVEKQLGIRSKAEIEERVGIEEFNRLCRENVLSYLKEHEALTERIAFWVDLDDAYKTFTPDYMESCWWVIRRLWDDGLVYQDYKSVPHCPRCGTSLSDHEVALGYQEDTLDPSVYIKFRLLDPLPGAAGDQPTFVIAWTTTPWTLPGNVALAVDPDARYAVVEHEGERYVVAEALREIAVGDFLEPISHVHGSDLVGRRYEPLYQPESDGWGVSALRFDAEGRLTAAGAADTPARRIVAADFVSMDDGTGIVHIAPAFGGEDFELGKREGLLFVQSVNLQGRMIAKGQPFDDTFVKDADPIIMQDLEQRGLMFHSGTIRHTYPFCWRCGTPLLYYAKPTWYIRTTARKDRLISLNQEINWYPNHIKNGRFGNWLEHNVDWAISRERYWGIPLPIWRCQDCGRYHCIGSMADLRELAVDKAAAEALSDLHRPYIDEVALRCEDCGGTMTRLAEVIDVWFDSGAMPYAQDHYPFENASAFERRFPADFICEGVDQTRGWFYTLHALSTLLFDSVAYRNVICLELILDDKGEKMSKSKGNTVEPFSVLDAHGADAVRWNMFTASPPWVPRRFSAKTVVESLRRFLLTLWNTYSFFVTYANLDNFEPQHHRADVPGPAHPEPFGSAQDVLVEGSSLLLDRWLLSELNVLVDKVTRLMDDYDPTDAGRAIEAFVDDLSNWYVRRSRRRFWKSEDDADKLSAYQTLHTTLVTLARLLAPFTPFVAEEMYQNLVRSWDDTAPESVHLADWPQADTSRVDEALMAHMRLAMSATSAGRSARSNAGIKVRQPLSRLMVQVPTQAAVESIERLASEIAAEVNVQTVEVTTPALPDGLEVVSERDVTVGLDTTLTPELVAEGMAREIVRRIQTMRKSAGFDISDRIATYYHGGEEIGRIMGGFGDYVRQETLSDELVAQAPPPEAFAEEHKLDGLEVTLGVMRVQ